MSEHRKTVPEQIQEIREDVAKLKINTKWGFIVLGVLIGSPHVGGPSAEQIVGAVIRLL